MNLTQNERLLAFLREHGSVTALEALNDLGIMRLASRVSDLKKMGYKFDNDVAKVKNRFGESCHVKRYKLVGEPNG